MATQYAPVDLEFMRSLRKRALAKIAAQGRTKVAGPRTWAKAAVLLAMFSLPYGLVLGNQLVFLHGPLLAIAHAALFLMVLAIAHDGAHRSFTEGSSGNRWTQRFFDVVGINSKQWVASHSADHHANTNILHRDGALDTFGLLRLHPGERRRWFHAAQHLYFPLVYACATILQCYVLVFAAFVASLAQGKLEEVGRSSKTMLLRHVAKAFFFSYTVLLPLAFSAAPTSHILLGGLIGHGLCGVMLGLFFQTTHLTSSTAFPTPDESGRIDQSFARHTLEVSLDVAPDNAALNWISSGLNIHATHHLLPDIAHEHLPDIAPIVEQTTKEFGLPYRKLGLREAVVSHVRMLRQLGAQTEWDPRPLVKTLTR